MGTVYGYIFVFSFIVSVLLTWIVRRIALKTSFVDAPSPRKIHKDPIPLMGGVGIFFTFVLTVLVHLVLSYGIKENTFSEGLLPEELISNLPGAYRVLPKLLGILGCGFLMMILGILDDKYNINPNVKLIGQIAVATFLMTVFDIRITLFVPNLFFSYFATLLWIILITNAFNLLDNMDGLAAGVALIAVLIFFLTAASLKEYFIALMLVGLSGSLLGFLLFNFPPAKIFMGDGGSLFIGYIISTLTVMGTYYQYDGTPNLFPVIMPLLILGVPLFDTISVICIRVKRNESLFKADQNHFSHRLVRLGMSPRGAVLFIYLVSFCIGISALLLLHLDEQACLVVLAQAIAILAIIAMLEYFAKRSGEKMNSAGKR